MRALVFALAILFAAPAHAERFSLSYNGYGLALLPLGDIDVDVGVYDDAYAVSAHLESSGLLNLFERTDLRAQASGVVANGAVYWRSYALDHHYSHKHRTIAMDAAEDGAVEARIEPNYRLWGEPPANDAQRRRSRDPLSTMIAMGVDVGITQRCAGAYPTFDGRFHYLLELAGGGVANARVGPYNGPVLKCELAYIAVAGFERSDAGRRRVPHGQVWFALMPEARFAPPVRISTPLSAGAATIRLSRLRRFSVEIDDAASATH